MVSRLDERLAKMENQGQENEQSLENLRNDIDEMNKLFEDHEKRLGNCVHWEQLENSFTKDFFNEADDIVRNRIFLIQIKSKLFYWIQSQIKDLYKSTKQFVVNQL